MLIGPDKIQSLLPHGPRMRLIDEIIQFDDVSMVAKTRQHLWPRNPLRRSCGMLPISSGIEFAGQVTALHGGVTDASERYSPKQGFLVMARDVTWTLERLDKLEDALEITVTLISRNQKSAMYEFQFTSKTQPQLMTGRIAVYFQGGSA